MNKLKVRRILAWISLMIFPLSLNYFSPYVSVSGAFDGIVAGSVLLFIGLLITSILFRRSWCAYLCPVSAIADFSEKINDRSVNRTQLSIVRYSVFGIWIVLLLSGFIIASKALVINPFYMTENGVSVDEPFKFVTYYAVLFTLIVLTLTIGKRGACHSICWMSPFLVLGTLIGDKLNLPQIRIQSNPAECISCAKCNQACPMSINVMSELKRGSIQSYDCINCSECEAVCPKQVLRLSLSKRR